MSAQGFKNNYHTNYFHSVLHKLVLTVCLVAFLMPELVVLEGIEVLATTALEAGSRTASIEKAEHTTILRDAKELAGQAQGQPPIAYPVHNQPPHSPTTRDIFPPRKKSLLSRIGGRLEDAYFSLKHRLLKLFGWYWFCDLFRPSHHYEPLYHWHYPQPLYQNHPHYYSPHPYPHYQQGPQLGSSGAHSSTQLTSSTDALKELRGTTLEVKLPANTPYTRVEYLGDYYRTHEFIEDKDSMFRTLAYIEYKDQNKHLQVKTELIKYITQNPEQFSKYVAKEGLHDTIQAGDTLYRLSSAKSADGVELAAFSQRYEMNLALVLKTSEAVHAQRYVHAGHITQYAGILLEDGHYNLLNSGFPKYSNW